MRWFKRILLLVVVSLLVFLGFQYPKLAIITGYAAKNMASTAFIAGRSEQSVNQNDHQVPLIEMAKSTYRETDQTGRATVLGLQSREAICREGLGCVLVPPGEKAPTSGATPRRSSTELALPYPLGHLPAVDTTFSEVDYALVAEAFDQAFKDPEIQRTRTLLVLYKGYLLREKYVEGFGPDTPVLGWSMTKSVLATLYGILEYQGQLDIDMPTGLAGWASDRRSQITFEDLLRMQSGLEWDEDYSGISDVTRMLFQSSSMPVVQARKELAGAPGTLWNYSSGTSNLLSGLLRDHLGNDQRYLDFPYRELADKIGMNSLLIETDLDGNFVGSSYAWASTRDWARFGLLYLREGQWNSTRLFHPDWVREVTTPTEHSNGQYGLHFWLNRGGTYPDAPPDLYMANGYQGQHVFIIPSKDLVVVRTGLAESPDFDANAVLSRLARAIRN
ncbi:serine hydrolase domain-containing protein [Robiginitalea sediminis]|uniref:serine hydrolase domain-containing protein n=1 Tax=Robiginitalea sediminis TaxID=1982593 RepID=UPI000B4AC4AF|nr:serine hydrolase [Robiginitalea sediminis]